ncbi:MAG: AI-2E family transporter [Peptostreptococcaceae bacterium]
MKIDFNKKYTTISIYSFIVVCCSILFASLIREVDKVVEIFSVLSATLQPFMIGFVIAYLLNFIMVFLENKILSLETFSKIKSKRAFSIIFSYIITGFTLYLFMLFVLPQLMNSLMGLANSIPDYLRNATLFINEILARIDKNVDISQEYLDLLFNQWQSFVDMAAGIVSSAIPMIGNFVTGVASSIWNIIIGIIISIYILIEKEKFIGLGKKIIFANLPQKESEYIINLGRRSNKTFGDFLSGKILDSVIIGILTFIILTVFKMPYTLLVSVIIGITNIIPFFGPFIGAVPAFVIIMFVDPVKALWFLVIILVIQQVDGNIIGPKILGDSIGISAFWILFSILVAGKVMGILGMIVGVPLFAITYSVIKEVTEFKLKEKGLPTETKDYM